MNLFLSLVSIAFILLTNQPGRLSGFKLSPNHFGFVMLRNTATNRRLDANSGKIATNSPSLVLSQISQIWQLLYPPGSNNSSGTYMMKSVVNGKQASLDSSNNLILATADETDSRQIWSFVQTSDQIYTIINMKTNNSLESDFQGNAILKSQTGSDFQGWTMTLTDIKSVYEILINTYGVFPVVEPVVITEASLGQRIDSNLRGELYLGNPSNSANQKWTIRQLDASIVTIQNQETKLNLVATNVCTNVSNFRTAIPDPSDKKQQWKITQNTDQPVIITNLANTACILPSKWYIDEAYSDITDLLFYSSGPFSLTFNDNNNKLAMDSSGNYVFKSNDSTDYSRWWFLAADSDTSTPYFIIKNLATGKFLDGGISRFLVTSEHIKWILLKHKNIYWLKNKATGMYLSCSLGALTLLNFFSPDECFKCWKIQIEPSYYSLSASIVDFSYIVPNNIFLNKKSKVDVLNSENIYNPTNAEIKRIYTKKIARENRFTLSFTESINIGTTLSFEGGIIFSKASTEISMNFGFESTQEKSYSEMEEITFQQEISVPANTSVNVLATLKTVSNFRIDFTALAIFRLNTYNATSRSIGESFTSGNSVAGYIRNQGFNGRIVAITEHAAYVALSGELTGDYGIEGQIFVNYI